jgi:hypothetical protein
MGFLKSTEFEGTVGMKTRMLLVIVSLCLLGPILLTDGCTKKGTDSPTEAQPGFCLMQEYFPLGEGDEWTWEVVFYEVQEEYVDGDSSLGEPFTDLNGNGHYDYGEPCEDLNYNGKCDTPYDPWLPGTPYEDRNANGQYDAPNGIWDLGEHFLDLDDDGVCDRAQKLSLHASTIPPAPGDSVVVRKGRFSGTYSDGTPGTREGDTDSFSDDSLGLRWHGHGDITNWEDVIARGEPITIARDTAELGDSVLTEGDYWWSCASWLSIFEGVEDVTVPAGEFRSCLRFKSVALGWDYNMEKYNGVSYQWYAKDVGLIKSTGPAKSQYWILKSATVGGRSYP